MAIAVEIPEAARRFLDGKAKGLWIDNGVRRRHQRHDDHRRTTRPTGERARRGAGGEPRGRRSRRSLGTRRLRGRVVVDHPGRSRPASSGASRRSSRTRSRSSRSLETLNNGKPIVALAATTSRTSRRCSATSRAGRPRCRARRSRPRPATSSPTRGTSRSASCAGIIPWNYPLMMAALEAGPRARLRQRDHHEAGRADAALDPALRRADRRGGPARRASSTW